MPPRQKFTKEEVITASLNLVRHDGMAGVTARALGTELGSSSRPIFTVFKNMDEVQRETISAAKAVYNGYVKRGLSQNPAFKGVGMEYIRFAKEEPKLFQLLFMTSKGAAQDLENVLSSIEENSSSISAVISDLYGEKCGLTREQCYKLYQYMWIFTHGIAALLATEVCDFTEAEVGSMLTEAFTGILSQQITTNGEKNND